MKLSFAIEIKEDDSNVNVKFDLTGSRSGKDVHGGFDVSGDASQMRPRLERLAESIQTNLPLVIQILSEDPVIDLKNEWLGDRKGGLS